MSAAIANDALPWAALLGLGALHGLNPGMGWLFAVALGFQEGSGRAVWRALPPLAAGHALAVAAAASVLVALGTVLDASQVAPLLGMALIALGAWRLRYHRHPRGAGMRATPRQLAAWSFLMATAHGAGLMVLPLMVDGAAAAHQHGVPVVYQAAVVPGAMSGWLGAGAHTAGYLLATGLVAWLVYEKLGLRRLTALWFNVDLAWALALVGTGVAVIL